MPPHHPPSATQRAGSVQRRRPGGTQAENTLAARLHHELGDVAAGVHATAGHPNDVATTAPANDCFTAGNIGSRMTGLGRQCPFDVVSSGRSAGLWHRQASNSCFRDFDPANGRRPMSAVPCKPVGGDAILWLPVRLVVAASVSSRRRQEVDSRGVSVVGQGQLSGSAVNWQSRPGPDIRSAKESLRQRPVPNYSRHRPTAARRCSFPKAAAHDLAALVGTRRKP